MSQERINALIPEVRNRINNVADEKYKVALMYSFLLGAEKGEVVEKKRPIGDDVNIIEINFLNITIDAVIFRLKKNKLSGYRYSILPLNDDFDNWVKKIYDYMSNFGSEAPFEFHENLDTSGTYFMNVASETFKDLSFDFQPYPRTGIGQIDSREKDFTSTCLKKLRIRDLIFNYNFNPLDLALFCAEDAQSKFFAEKTKEIRKLDLSGYSENELKVRAIPYITKLLKKNEVNDFVLPLLNQVECYLAIYYYEKIKDGDYKNELITETAQLLNKTETDVIQLFQNIAYLDSAEPNEKQFSESVSESRLLNKMYDWFSSNRDEALNYYSTFYTLSDSDNSYSYQKIEEIEKEAGEAYTEEGKRKDQVLRMGQRSQALIFEARKQYKDVDVENKLRCKACGYVKPESINREIVEMHHLTPIKEMDELGEKRLLSEATKYVIPLCPICHRIIHSANPLYSIKEVKSLRSV